MFCSINLSLHVILVNMLIGITHATVEVRQFIVHVSAIFTPTDCFIRVINEILKLVYLQFFTIYYDKKGQKVQLVHI